MNKRQRKKYEKKHPDTVWYGQLKELARIHNAIWKPVELEIPWPKPKNYYEVEKK